MDHRAVVDDAPLLFPLYVLSRVNVEGAYDERAMPYVSSTLLVLSCDQYGDYLPIYTDERAAEAASEELRAQQNDPLIYPLIVPSNSYLAYFLVFLGLAPK